MTSLEEYGSGGNDSLGLPVVVALMVRKWWWAVVEVVVESQQEVVEVELWVGIVVRPKVEWWLFEL